MAWSPGQTQAKACCHLSAPTWKMGVGLGTPSRPACHPLGLAGHVVSTANGPCHCGMTVAVGDTNTQVSLCSGHPLFRMS